VREEELCCKALQEKLRAQRLQLEKLQAPPPPPQEMIVVNPRQHEPPKVCPRLILIEEISDCSELEGEDCYQRRH
jgi:hypothetical protein